MEIEYIKEHKDAYDIIVHNDTHSACVDLLADKDITIKSKSKGIMTCGIRILIPEGYYAEIRNKSRIGFKNDVYIYNGIMDSGYSGDWSVKAFNYGERDFVVKKGDSIAQVLILKKPNIVMKEVSDGRFKEYEESSVRKAKGFSEISLRENSNIVTTHKTIYASLKVEGLHNFPGVINAFGEEVEYLEYPHRHNFTIKVFSEVNKLNGEKEFICLKHTVNNFLQAKFFCEKYQCCDFGFLSCEAIAQLLINE